MDFFFLSKMLWAYFNPLNILLFLLLIVLVFNFFNKNKFFKIINLITFILFILIVFLPNGAYLLWKLESSYSKPEILPNTIDGILILGGGTNAYLSDQHDEINLNENVERLTEPIELMKKFPNAKIIYSGGEPTATGTKLIGIDVARKFYTRMGMDMNRIIFESKSRNTYENIFFSKKFIENKNNEKWLLVTSAFHMKRAMKVAEKLKLNFIPYPVDYILDKNFKWIYHYKKGIGRFLRNIYTFNIASHEYVGLIAYYLTKRSNKIY